jgi:hypothetical protein
VVLNLRNPPLPHWPDELRPTGEGSHDKEPFDPWWKRHGVRLAHLHVQIAEQWIYRHWTHSHFSFLPIDALSWRSELWESAQIVSDVVRYGHDRTPYNPDFDYKTFQRRGGEDRHATARALDQGTWDYPIVVLETPDGFIDAGRDRPDARFVLIEGHQRMRYLSALLQRRHSPLGPHELFILRCGAEL